LIKIDNSTLQQVNVSVTMIAGEFNSTI